MIYKSLVVDAGLQKWAKEMTIVATAMYREETIAVIVDERSVLLGRGWADACRWLAEVERCSYVEVTWMIIW